MNFFNNYLKYHWYVVVIIILCLLLFGTEVYLYKEKSSSEDNIVREINENDLKVAEKTNEEETFKVDIKGAVKKPGVYEVSNSSIIDDVIKLAGGLNGKAYTNNINLSKKVENEMVIYIFTKAEYQRLNVKNDNLDACHVASYEISSCTNDGNSVVEYNDSNLNISKDGNSNNINNVDLNNDKISINNATVAELTKLDGIGEAKALKIIEYRNSIGGFKTIEEIKNVSGIGDAAFEKIKDNIKL